MLLGTCTLFYFSFYYHSSGGLHSGRVRSRGGQSASRVRTRGGRRTGRVRTRGGQARGGSSRDGSVNTMYA